MVDFAGYALPARYRGIIAEHQQARNAAALFDVSHMGQIRICGPRAIEAIESLVPGDIAGLAKGRMRYTQLTNENGGILDDLIVTRLDGGDVMVIVNAACKTADVEYMGSVVEAFGCRLSIDDGAALLALQGPAAETALAAVVPGAQGLTFMEADAFQWEGAPVWISRSGYTGEDGFEISLPAGQAKKFAEELLVNEAVDLSGLGARDSLRLEAGLCLYGHDIDTTTTPVEAGLTWSIGKRRWHKGGFPGADAIRQQLQNGVSRRRVGLRPEGRAPAREGMEIQACNGEVIGTITSGGFGPSVGGPIAMGYVATSQAAAGNIVSLILRGRPTMAKVARLPFITPQYKR